MQENATQVGRATRRRVPTGTSASTSSRLGEEEVQVPVDTFCSVAFSIPSPDKSVGFVEKSLCQLTRFRGTLVSLGSTNTDIADLTTPVHKFEINFHFRSTVLPEY